MFAPRLPAAPDPDSDDNILNDYYAWTGLLRAGLAILSRIGYVLIQVGSVPISNVNLILLQNAVDVCWVTVTYLVIGSFVSHNIHVKASTAKGRWIGHEEIDRDEVIIGWTAVIIGSAICTSAIVGRTHTVGYLVIGLLLSAVVQPLLIHWIWSREGFLRKNALSMSSNSDDFRDFAGASVVHLAGGLSGLIGCMVLGRRILRLRDIDDASISASSSVTVFAGHLMVFVGLQSLSIPNSEVERVSVLVAGLPRVYLNNLLAAGSCCLCVVALHFIPSREGFNHWTVMRCVQAMVSGLVIVSAGSNVYRPSIAIVLGCVGGTIFFLISKIVFHRALEDNCNIVATHLACTIFGSILAPLCAFKSGTDTNTFFGGFLWQILCLLLASALIIIIMASAFIGLEFFGILRNRSEHLNHARAIVALRRAPRRTCFKRIFPPDSNSVYLQPGSLPKSGQPPSAGSRFWKYLREIDTLEKAKVGEEAQAGSSRNT